MRRLLEAEVELLGHQQEIVVVDDVFGLFLECAEEEGADCDYPAVLCEEESTVGSLIQVRRRGCCMPVILE